MLLSTFQITHKPKPSNDDNNESLAPGRNGFNLEIVIFKLISWIVFLSISREFALE